MKKTRKQGNKLPIYFLVCLLTCYFPILFPSISFADLHQEAGTTGACFLKLGIGARPISMGEAFVAVADDPNTILWNPAGLVNIKNSAITATHNQWIDTIGHEFLGYIQPFGKWGNFAASLNLLRIGSLAYAEEDEKGFYSEGEGTFTPSDIAYCLSYARGIFKNTSFGVTFKLIEQTNADTKGTGFGSDIGWLWSLFRGSFNLGLSVQNFGPRIKIGDEKFPLPRNIKLGTAYKFRQKLVLAIDVGYPIDNYVNISGGGEYWFRKLFAVRLGYKYTISESLILAGLRAGCGFKWQNLCVDYAFVPQGALGHTHRVSLTFLIRLPTWEERKAKLPEPEVKKRKKGLVITFQTHFTRGSNELTEEDKLGLEKIAEFLQKRFPDGKIRIEGYTDNRGTAEKNLRLSRKRAREIAIFLAQKGIENKRLSFVGYGEAHPIASNDSAEGRAKNNRVEIVIKRE